ncbi:MAG TPA: hypothetical protein VJ553_02110 [Candidatus Paceibacterota bacterium]|nr:hypothetical protein [Candidatus Paceibacterota bacterium]
MGNGYLTKTQRVRIAQAAGDIALIALAAGELADIASPRDLDTAHLILKAVCGLLGVDVSEVPQYIALEMAMSDCHKF